MSIQRLRERRSAKWSMYGEGILPSFYAEMDFPLAPVIAETLRAAIESGDLGYANAPGTGLHEAFADFARRRWAWEIDPEAITAVPDVMIGVAELLRILTSPGAGVIINTPVYQPFFTVIAETGRRAVEVPMARAQAGWALPLDGIRDALAAGSEAVLLCNPHNPTGYVASRDELIALAQMCAEFNVVVLADEIHAPLTMPGSVHIPFPSLYEAAGTRAIVLTSASKGWNIPGLKCALAVASSTAMREASRALPEELPDRVGHLGVLASIEAFARGEPWLDELISYLEDTRRWLPGLLSDRLPEILYEPGDATYLAWLDCRGLGLGDDPAAHFLRYGQVALSPGFRFGLPGRGFVRLNFGTARSLVEEAVSRMAKSLAVLRRPT